MNKHILNFGISFIVLVVVLSLLINTFAAIIGLCGSFVDWNMIYFYEIFEDLYGTPKLIREGILSIFGLSFFLSFVCVAIWNNE